MGRNKNIFFNIVNSENSMTELLCNYMAYRPFRDAFLGLFLDKSNAGEIDYDNFLTQYTLSTNNSRPDLAVVNDNYEILVEVKIDDVGLTGNQPLSYLEHLKSINKIHKWLVLLIPADYIYENQWKTSVEQFYSQNPNSNINREIIKWIDIIRILEENDLVCLSERCKEFYELLRSWFEIEKISFITSEVFYMYKTEIPQIIVKLFKIVDVVKNAHSKKFKVKARSGNDEYGIYFSNDDDKGILYFGLWYDFWEKRGYPLCYGVHPKHYSQDIINKFQSLHQGKYLELDGWMMCVLEPAVLEKENCSEEISKIIGSELSDLTS